MKYSILLFVLLGLAGCASIDAQHAEKTVRIDRLSDDEMARIMPKQMTTISLEGLVKLTKDGLNADQIIAKLKEANTVYDLTPSQVIALNQQGVDAKVLDYLHTSSVLSLQSNLAEVMNQHDKTKADEIQMLKRQLMLQSMTDPFCRGPGYYPNGFRSHFGFGFGSPFYGR